MVWMAVGVTRRRESMHRHELVPYHQQPRTSPTPQGRIVFVTQDATSAARPPLRPSHVEHIEP